MRPCRRTDPLELAKEADAAMGATPNRPGKEMRKEPKVTMLVFRVDAQRYALHLAAVERVLPMMAIAPLPGAPEMVLGAIMLAGRVIPALNMRRRFGLPNREPELGDRLLIAQTGKRSVALWVDDVAEIVERPREEIVPAHAVLPGLSQIEGVMALADGLVIIHDLGRCLSLEEEQQLDGALALPSRAPIARTEASRNVDH